MAKTISQVLNQAYEPFNRYRWAKHFNRLHDGILKTGDVPPASRVTFELTMKCNLSCQMCFRDRSNDEELNLEAVAKVIQNLGSAVKEISLIGGEIFLRKDIFDLLDLLKKNGLKVNFHTNGTLIDETSIERLSGYDNFGRIGFSIDGTKELHNRIRGSDTAFEKTIKGIKLMAGLFPTAVNSVIVGDNVKQLEEIFCLLNEKGVVEYRVEPEMFSSSEEVEDSRKIIGVERDIIITQIKENLTYDYSFGEFRRIKERLKKLSWEKGMRFNIAPRVADIDDEDFYKGDIREKKKLFCKHLLVPRINPQGNLIFCHLIKKEFGNLVDNSLEYIWNGEEIREFRKRLLKSNLLPICKRCCRLRSI
ncbi:MAG: radical SAM/SPASM domain-containing protein [Candidatus Hydrothermarchaeales archaeon]